MSLPAESFMTNSNPPSPVPSKNEKEPPKQTSSSSSTKSSSTAVNFDSNPIFKGKSIMLDASNIDDPKLIARYLVAYGCPNVSAEWHTFNSSYAFVISSTWNEVKYSFFHNLS